MGKKIYILSLLSISILINQIKSENHCRSFNCGELNEKECAKQVISPNIYEYTFKSCNIDHEICPWYKLPINTNSTVSCANKTEEKEIK